MGTDLGNKTIGLKRDADMTIKFQKTVSKRVKILDLTKKIDGEQDTERA